MNAVTLNSDVINAVRERISGKTDIFHFLSNTLSLGKEAVYRRIRGEVLFSFHEVYLIAQRLNISLDYFLKTSSENTIVFELIQQQYYGQKEESITFKGFHEVVRLAAEDPSSKFELSHNLFPQIPTHLFYHLSKYTSLKWVYQHKDLYHIKTYKEIEYPQSTFEMHRNNNLETMKIKNTSYIWDYSIVEMLVREIKYFFSINILDKEDVAILKEELHEFLSYVENLADKGTYPNGNKLDIYISSMNTDTAYSYIEAAGLFASVIGAFDIHYIISTDKEAFKRMKDKIFSLKRASTLISGTGESFKAVFFRKQHELVDEL